MKLSKDMNKLS